jgi:osmotically-inducible protein OsmY
MPANDEVMSDVIESLWDSQVDSRTIAVAAEDGHVTLRGTVGSLREKREAGRVAARTFGVVSLRNELDVRLGENGKRHDDELRAEILQALMRNSLVPSTVDVKVDRGFVTLIGTAERQHERDEADRVASELVGPLDVLDRIDVSHPEPDSASVKAGIERAFERDAEVDGDRISVTASGGTVTIEGVVSSWSEHEDVVAAVWAAPGVTHVDDRLVVESQ